MIGWQQRSARTLSAGLIDDSREPVGIPLAFTNVERICRALDLEQSGVSQPEFVDLVSKGFVVAEAKFSPVSERWISMRLRIESTLTVATTLSAVVVGSPISSRRALTRVTSAGRPSQR